jgi:hypothetical protein
MVPSTLASQLAWALKTGSTGRNPPRYTCCESSEDCGEVEGGEVEMPDENVYDVSPGKDGWGVERRGAQRASGRFDTKAEAVQRGRELAKGQKGRLVIRKQDGTIQEERTYRKDPYPPPG